MTEYRNLFPVRMTGLIILLIFVLVVFCCGTVAIIVCYQRTKSRQRRAEKETYQSRMGSEVGLAMAFDF